MCKQERIPAQVKKSGVSQRVRNQEAKWTDCKQESHKDGLSSQTSQAARTGGGDELEEEEINTRAEPTTLG